MMNREELQALGRVLDHYGHDELRCYKDEGNPPGHIAESLMALVHYRQVSSIGMVDEDEGRAKFDYVAGDQTVEEVASKPNDEPAKPNGDDDGAADGMRMQILYSVFNHAALPDALKTFIDNAIKDNDKKLLMTAQVALDNYQGDMDLPF